MIKPLLAATVTDLDKINFPVYVSPKLDGIRCLIINGEVLTRSLKPVPNRYIREALSHITENIDGELIIEGASFSQISSAVMSKDGEPNFKYMVFDKISEEPYFNRSLRIFLPKEATILKRYYVEDIETLLRYEQKFLNEGYEGLMIRDPRGPYKYGRSTEKEGILLKLKRFTDSEAIIKDFVFEKQNLNPKKINELGMTKRSSNKANKVEKAKVGVIICEDIKTGQTIRISAGLDSALKQHMFCNPEIFLGKIVKYKSMPSVKDKPRHSTFLGFRSELDMS